MNTRLLLAAIIALTLFSCGPDSKTQVVNGGKYTIELPASFKKTTDLNKDASLQYQNALKELYVIVIDEPQTELESAIMNNGLENDYTADLKGYSRLIIDGINPSVKVDTVADFKDGTLNGMKSRQLNMTGITNGVNIYWKFAFLEGKNNYYQIMVWTLADNKKKFDDDMQDIINSFKETDRSAKQ